MVDTGETYNVHPGAVKRTSMKEMNALGFEYAEGYKFDHLGEGIDYAKLAAEPLAFHQYNLRPLEHGMHPDQRTEVQTITVGEDRPDAFTPAATKEYSHGAVRATGPYKRGTTFAAEGFSGYTPLWRPPENPLDGGKSTNLYTSGVATYSGYMGCRPGEKSDPFVAGKVNVSDARAMAPWQGESRDSSMAARIAQRSLAAAGTRKGVQQP